MIFKVFKEFQNLKYGISQKAQGPMELAGVDFSLRANRQKFLQTAGIDSSLTVSAGIVHSNSIAVVENSDAGKTIPACDGLVSADKNLYLAMTVADCFPVYLYAPKQNKIGLAHCGWKGTLAGLAPKMVAQMQSSLKEILIGIGPGIGSCHFEIKQDILPKFKDYPEAVTERGGKIFVALVKILLAQLSKAGVPVENIESLGECTACNPEKYFSYRLEKPREVKAMLAYIGRI